MADGRVMFAGGAAASGVVNTVDILGTNGAFTAGPPMLTARANAACALLQDGRIFVSGGNDGINALDSAEYFTPATGAWTSAGSMHTARYGHTASVTEMGAVLLMGGKTNNGVTSQLEVFRPANNRFTVLGNLSSPRTNYAVVMVDNHRTLIAGGSDGQHTLNSIDVFDSYTNGITPAGAMLAARSSFGAAKLLDGTIMFTGGFDQNGAPLASTEIFNADKRTAVAGPNLNVARGGHQTYALPGNGSVIVFGGSDGQNPLSSSEIYQPWTGKFSNATPMNSARNGAATSMMAGAIVAAGGRNAAGLLSGAENYLFSTVQTDKADYQPGNTATFTGAGWKPGENVALTVTNLSTPAPVTEFAGTAVADGSGRISVSSFHIAQKYFGTKFLLDAKGSQSEAQTVFTDADVTQILVGQQGPVYGTGIPTPCAVAPPNCAEPYGTAFGFPFEVTDVTTPANIPIGNVILYDNNITLAAANLSQTFTNNQAAQPVPVGTPNPETGNITADVNDQLGIDSPGFNAFTLQFIAQDTNSFENSTTASITVQVSQVQTDTAIQNPNPTSSIAYGAQATLTATVTTETTVLPIDAKFSLPPEGTLTFKDGNHADDCAGVRTDGPNSGESTYTCKTPLTLGVGTHNYGASYDGILNIWQGSDTGGTTVPVTVTAVGTTTAITTSSGTPAVYPTPMSITATVTQAAGPGPATGTVNFYDGSNDLCGVAYPLSGSPATATSCNFILAGGAHSLTATYTPGSSDFLTSSSGATSFTITPQPTVTVVTGGGSSTLGANVTMTATVSCNGFDKAYCGTTVGSVSGVGATVGTPAGSVFFYDSNNGDTLLNTGGTLLTTNVGTGTSSASFSTTNLAGGLHNIVAVYTPGTGTAADWGASDSTATPVAFNVSPVNPTFNIQISPASPLAYQALTFTVAAVPAGGQTPTGSVVLTVGGTGGFVTSSQVLNNGTATFNTSGVGYGNHSLAIAYTIGATEMNFSATPSAAVTPSSFNVGSMGTTTTVISSLPSPIQFGQNATFTATVAAASAVAAGSPAPTGTVTFAIGLNTLCMTVALTNGSAQCTPATAIAANTSAQTIAATYNPTNLDLDYLTSSGSILMQVNPATTTTTVSANTNPINLLGSVTYTVSVSAAQSAGNPTGAVTLTDNGNALSVTATGGCPLTGLSAANPATECFSVTYTGAANLAGGTHNIIANFAGSQNFGASSSSAITETVNPATVTINTLSVMSGGNSITTEPYYNGGAATTLNFNYSFGANPPSPTPSQSFQIYDGGTLLGTLPVPGSGTSTLFTLPLTLAVGSHTFYVKYPSGDPNYSPVSSAGFAFSVTKFTDTVGPSGSVTVGTAGSPNKYGTQVTLGGTVSTPGSSNPAPAPPTGTLTFSYGAATLGNCTLTAASNGSCNLTVTSAALTVAATQPETFGISYNGDSNYASATGSGTIYVGQNTVTGSINTSPSGSAAFGVPVTVTATFGPAGTGSVGTPSGTATIYDALGAAAAVSIGMVPLNSSGIATLTTSSLAPGSHVLSAAYNGDTNFSLLTQGSGPSTSLTVNTGNTTVSLSPSANPVSLNQTVTYNFTVTGGPSQPTGTVTLTDAIGGGPVTIPSCNGVALIPAASGNTSSGACSVTYDSSDHTIHAAGAHPIVATYTPTAGTTSWTSASSGLLTENVGQIAPTISQPVTNPNLPITFPTSVTYSVSLTPVNPSPAYGANTVQFYDNGVALGSPVSVTTLATSTFTTPAQVPVGGQHTVTAQFIGDTNYAPSLLSPKLVYTVGKGTPTVTTATPLSMTVPYFSMIGNATYPLPQVTVAGTGGVKPTGSVSLMAGTTNLATGTLDANGQITFTNIQLPASLVVPNSPFSFFVQYGGDNNWAAAQSTAATLTLTKAPDNVTVTSSSSNPVFGQSITLTATFASVGNPVSGNIDFVSSNGSSPNPVCSAAIITNGVATCTTSALALGANTITVSNLQNEANHTLAGATVTTTLVTVGTSTTATSIVSSQNPSAPGVAVSFTATVTVLPPGNGTGTLNGTVTFTWTQNSPTSNPLTNACANLTLSSKNSGATVTCTVPANSVPFNASGQYFITATYSPAVNETNTTSSVTITQTVGQPVPSFTSIATPTNPAVYGQPVTITATFITALSSLPQATPPTGMVQFYDGVNQLGTQQPIASVTGQNNTYMAQITVPSGSIPTFTVGNHSISAAYVPGAADNYGADNSATQLNPKILSLVVGQGGTASGATSIAPGPEVFATQGIPNAPVYGEQIMFSATITPVSPATGCPTGFAYFSDAGTQIGPTIQVVASSPCTNSSTVSITTSSLNAAGQVPNLGVGTHANIKVTYLGDANFSSSSSTAFPSVMVSPAPTITALTAIPAAAQKYGTEFTLNAQVCAENVNGGPSKLNTCESTPFPGFKGLMMFYDGSTLLNPGGVGIAVDANSGTAGITITLASPPLQAAPVGTHNITAQYITATPTNPPTTIDPNFAGSASAPQQLQVGQGPTTTTVTSTVNPTVYGQPVTFTATVADAASFGVLPTGSVTFLDGALPLGTVALANVSNSAQAQLTVPNGIDVALAGAPAPGATHAISVQYSGDINYAASTTASALAQVVNQAATQTVLASSQNGSTTGQQVTLTATVTVIAPGAPVLSGANAGPTGTVTFYTNYNTSTQAVLGTGNLTHASGAAYVGTLTLNSLTLSGGNGEAQVSVTAVYSGDQDYLGSAGSLNQSVSKVQSSVTVTSSQNPSVLGTPVTYTIQVSAISPGTGTPAPTGAVTLFDGSNVLSTPALTQSCGATCTGASFTTALPIGGHLLSAGYNGDLNYQPASGGTMNEIVNKIVSTLNLTSSVPAGAVASQVITFTVQIQPNPPVGVPYPTGQIGFFMDGATQIGAASLASGVATLSTTLPAGNHQIQAFYVGDANWTAAQSIYLAQVVGTATTTTQIVSSANPSVFGQPVVVTVTVAVPYPGTIPATGTVQLYDGGNAIGTPLSANNGTFSTTLTNLSVGTHSITAQFQANGSFSQSTSASLSQIVNKAPTVTTVAAMPNSTTSNQSMTLTAVVTVPSPGSTATVAPTGTVQFVDATTSQVLGSAPLNSVGGVWTATLNTSALTSGSQTQLLTATYSGDADFATSTSPAIPVSVFTTTITVVNAAGYTGTNFAPNSFAAMFGSNLAYTTATATVTPWPSSLSGTTVTVTDSNGVARLAPLYYVSLPQIDFIIPANTAYGLAYVTVTNASGETASTTILISPTSPGLYSENASGMGVAAGYVLAVHSDGTQSTQQPLFQLNPNTQQFVGVPIVWANSTDQEYLVLYGTGIRGAASTAVTATMNGINVPVIYAGAQPQFLGEDQVNMGPIPTSLKGAGTVNVQIVVNGQASNTVTVTIQ